VITNVQGTTAFLLPLGGPAIGNERWHLRAEAASSMRPGWHRHEMLLSRESAQVSNSVDLADVATALREPAVTL